MEITDHDFNISLTENEKDYIKDTIQMVQSKVILEDEADDVKCVNCGNRTYLPYEYMENVGISLCNECTVKSSGHAECEAPYCVPCQDVAKILDNRMEISKLFQEGSLIIVTEEENQDLTKNEKENESKEPTLSNDDSGMTLIGDESNFSRILADISPINSPIKEFNQTVQTRRCRKAFGIARKDEWCKKCRWKKACERVPRN